MLAEERKEAEKTNGPNHHHHRTFRPIRHGIVVLLSRKVGLLTKLVMTMGEAASLKYIVPRNSTDDTLCLEGLETLQSVSEKDAESPKVGK